MKFKIKAKTNTKEYLEANKNQILEKLNRLQESYSDLLLDPRPYGQKKFDYLANKIHRLKEKLNKMGGYYLVEWEEEDTNGEIDTDSRTFKFSEEEEMHSFVYSLCRTISVRTIRTTNCV